MACEPATPFSAAKDERKTDVRRRALIAGGLTGALAPLLVQGSPAAAQTMAGPSLTRPLQGPTPLMQGWREAVVVVPDLAPWLETLTRVGGWELVVRTAPHPGLSTLWRLPAGARTEEAVMRNTGTRRGYIRLVVVTGADQRQIRADDQAWESGGVAALDLRVLDLEATRAALHARGWRAPSDPVRYEAYGVEVVQWAPVSPDGVRLSFIQRIAPPLVGWGELKRWSRAANAAIVTADMKRAQDLFGARLGLREASHTDTVGGDGPNVMGLPWTFARSLPIDIRGFGGGADGDSAIELISMPEAAGRDFSPGAHPPNLGIAALRVRVADAETALTRLRDLGLTRQTLSLALRIDPYGPCRGFAFDGLDGVRLEFFSPASDVG